MTRHLETEFKLRARQPLELAMVDAVLRELGVAIRAATSSRHSDVYYDDGDGTLARAGLGLRIRESATGRRATCKDRGQRADGRFVRTETEALLASGPPANARDLPDVVRDAVEPFVLDRPLQPVLHLATTREIRLLQQDGNDLGELAVDRVEATAAGRRVTFQELELEVLDDLAANERLAQALQQRLALLPAEDDKPGHAAALLGLPVPGKTASATAPDAPLADTVAASAAHHLGQMRAAEAALRGSTGAEPLHALRVAVRRLRSIVRAFRDLWPSPAGELALERLGECGRRLGAVRDFDVLLKALAADAERLPGALQPAARRALGWITSQRDAANAELHAWLRSAERLRATRELTEQLAAPDRTAEAANQPTAAAIPPRIAAAAAQLRKQCRRLPEDLPLPPLHALRIAVKRLRYLAEEFGSLPDLDLARPLADLTALQQVLGDVCDHDRGQERLLGWIQPAVAAASDDLATAGALGALAMLQTRASAKGRRKVARALRAIDRKKVWRRLAAPEQPDANMTA